MLLAFLTESLLSALICSVGLHRASAVSAVLGRFFFKSIPGPGSAVSSPYVFFGLLHITAFGSVRKMLTKVELLLLCLSVSPTLEHILYSPSSKNTLLSILQMEAGDVTQRSPLS